MIDWCGNVSQAGLLLQCWNSELAALKTECFSPFRLSCILNFESRAIVLTDIRAFSKTWYIRAQLIFCTTLSNDLG